MEKTGICSTCRSPKAQLLCEVCNAELCKGCMEFLDEASFPLMRDKPALLKHSRYCQACFDEHIVPAREKYDATVERAKQVVFIPKSYRGTVPILKKAKLEVSVKECADRDLMVMELAFQAAEQGYNALIQGELTQSKVRNEGYQKKSWSGRALPANVDESRLEEKEGILPRSE